MLSCAAAMTIVAGGYLGVLAFQEIERDIRKGGFKVRAADAGFILSAFCAVVTGLYALAALWMPR